MNQNKGTSQYAQIGLESAIAHASPHRLIQLLLEGSLKSIAIAKGHIQRSEKGPQGEQISKTISIIGGLQGALKSTDDNEISQNLERLYDYMTRTLFEANRESSEEKLVEVSTMLLEIKSSWDAIPEEQHKMTSLDSNG